MTAIPIRNGQAVDVPYIPMLKTAEFHSYIRSAVASGARIAALFGQPLDYGRVRLWAVLAHDAQHALSVLSTAALGGFPSLTLDCPQAHPFEREIFEQTGLRPQGHHWLKPVR